MVCAGIGSSHGMKSTTRLRPSKRVNNRSYFLMLRQAFFIPLTLECRELWRRRGIATLLRASESHIRPEPRPIVFSQGYWAGPAKPAYEQAMGCFTPQSRRLLLE